MVRIRTLCVVAALALLMLSPASAGELKSELGAMFHKLDAAMLAGDVDAIVTFYADDAYVMPNYAGALDGRAALRAHMEQTFAAGIKFTAFSGKMKKVWESDGMIYAVGSYTLSISMPGMPQPVKDTGKAFTVLRRTKGGFEIVYDIWNTDQNPMQRGHGHDHGHGHGHEH